MRIKINKPGEEYPEGGLDRASEEAYELARFLEAGESLSTNKPFHPFLDKQQVLSGKYDKFMSRWGIGFALVRTAWEYLYANSGNLDCVISDQAIANGPEDF